MPCFRTRGHHHQSSSSLSVSSVRVCLRWVVILFLLSIWKVRLSVCEVRSSSLETDDTAATIPRSISSLRSLQSSSLAPTSAPQSTPTPSVPPTIAPTASSTNSTEQQQQIDWEYENIVALRWNIQNPPQVSYSGLKFDLHFTVSDFIQAQEHVRYDLYEGASCGYNGDKITDAGYITTVVTQDDTPVGGGINPRIITLSSSLVPQTIAKSTSYQEEQGSNDASITYCVRFSLWSGPYLDPSATQVNYVDVTVSLSVDLTDGFSIRGQSLQARDRGVETTDDEFFVEAFLCQENGESYEDMFTLVQGEMVRVCVRPTPQAYEVGFRMRRIEKFTFVQGYTTQEAIINQNVAVNGLTELWCDPGADQCMLETLLFAYFFHSQTGSVGGNGIASLQWGAGTSARLLRRTSSIHGEDEYGRNLQQSSKLISIPIFGVERAETRPMWGSGCGDITFGKSSLKAVTCSLLVTIAMLSSSAML